MMIVGWRSSRSGIVCAKLRKELVMNSVEEEGDSGFDWIVFVVRLVSFHF